MNKLEKTHYNLVYTYYPKMKHTTPRWESIKYVAKEKIKYWRLRKNYNESDKELAIETILWQTFAGVNHEWLEEQKILIY